MAYTNGVINQKGSPAIVSETKPASGVKGLLYFAADGTSIERWNSTQWVPYTLGPSGGILQGGNSFGANMVIGTNDNFGVQIETNNATRLTITNAGAASFTGALSAASLGTLGTLLVADTATFQGNASVAGTFTATGMTTSNAATMTIGNTVNQSLVLQTNSTARLTITGAGAATFSGALTVSGAFVASTTSSLGAVTVGSTLGVTGTTTLQMVNINNTISIGSNIIMQWAGQQQITGSGGGGTMVFTQPAGGYVFNFNFSTNTFFRVQESGISTVQGTLSAQGIWKLGQVRAGAVVLDAANYVEVEIGGAIVKLLKAT